MVENESSRRFTQLYDVFTDGGRRGTHLLTQNTEEERWEAMVREIGRVLKRYPELLRERSDLLVELSKILGMDQETIGGITAPMIEDRCRHLADRVRESGIEADKCRRRLSEALAAHQIFRDGVTHSLRISADKSDVEIVHAAKVAEEGGSLAERARLHRLIAKSLGWGDSDQPHNEEDMLGVIARRREDADFIRKDDLAKAAAGPVDAERSRLEPVPTNATDPHPVGVGWGEPRPRIAMGQVWRLKHENDNCWEVIGIDTPTPQSLASAWVRMRQNHGGICDILMDSDGRPSASWVFVRSGPFVEPSVVKPSVGTDSSGVKYDEGKPSFALIPWDAMFEVARVFTEGAKKYEPRNWEKGLAYSRVFSSTQRHLTSWFQHRETYDPDGTSLRQISQAVWGCLVLLAYELRGRDDLDDRPMDDTPKDTDFSKAGGS